MLKSGRFCLHRDTGDCGEEAAFREYYIAAGLQRFVSRVSYFTPKGKVDVRDPSALTKIRLHDPQKVVVLLHGEILDENYTELLLTCHNELNLIDVIALDKVQKKHPIDEDAFKRLKAQGLVEGRRPNLFVSAKIAAATGDKATYIKNRAFDRLHYREMVVAYLRQFGDATRADFEKLLMGKLSDLLNDRQKKDFIRNLLQDLKRDGVIEPNGPNRWARWRLSKRP